LNSTSDRPECAAISWAAVAGPFRVRDRRPHRRCQRWLIVRKPPSWSAASAICRAGSAVFSWKNRS